MREFFSICLVQFALQEAYRQKIPFYVINVGSPIFSYVPKDTGLEVIILPSAQII